MSFSDDKLTFYTDILAERGQDVTYTAIDGTETPGSASLGAIEKDADSDDLGGREIWTRQAMIPLTFIAAPAIGATLTIGSDVWSIVHIPSQDEHAAKLTLQISVDKSRHSADYKKREKIK